MTKRVNDATPEIREILVPKEVVAQREVVAQEFCRLIIPTHPKTRLVTNNAEDATCVLSKQVSGFTSLQSIHP